MKFTEYKVDGDCVIDDAGGIVYDDLSPRAAEIIAELLTQRSIAEAAPAPRFEPVKEAFALLSDAQRLEIVHSCCTECGRMGSGCQCWNDE